ncbi:class I adenylate-forming enzyme family protein [Pontibaca salina]|uniref:3-methylmercaptopropionyl-CoA ligase n=1 Tax=Pontibaca salina TaxID=2795731 RepID=A0A934HRU2_9RHOB|nr:AMP-binding protein [Pontibaca salina]MBI6629510.1 AMP-binding protein [Pontibaca salina]
MNISRWLYQTALSRPDTPAIRSGTDLHASYGDFAQRSAAMGRYLADTLNVARGERVALFVQNCPEYLEIVHAVLWIGAIIVPINPKLHPREAAWIIGNAEAKVAITETGKVFPEAGDLHNQCIELSVHDSDLKKAVDSAPPMTPPVDSAADDVAWLFYTSGTTGRPKGVMATHRNLVAMSLAYAIDVDAVSAQDNALYAAPMSHGAGLYHFPIIRAGGCHIVPQSGGFDPDEIAGLARKLDNLVFFAAPTMVKRLIAHAADTGYDGTGIKTIIYGGGPMYLADIDEALDRFGPRFAQIYGQGESPMTITALPRDLVADTTHPDASARRASVGFAQACVQVRIVDDGMRELPAGEVGEIVVAGDTVMKGYWRNAEATAEVIADGWLRTGDLGTMDANGFVTLTDRSRDVIISGGSNIYPREVEETLLAHDAVFEASVIGMPSTDWGEEVVAFVVLRDGTHCDMAELDTWCRSRMASFKKPKRYYFVQDLPKNSYGKVLKTSLRERAELLLEEKQRA